MYKILFFCFIKCSWVILYYVYLICVHKIAVFYFHSNYFKTLNTVILCYLMSVFRGAWNVTHWLPVYLRYIIVLILFILFIYLFIWVISSRKGTPFLNRGLPIYICKWSALCICAGYFDNYVKHWACTENNLGFGSSVEIRKASPVARNCSISASFAIFKCCVLHITGWSSHW